MLGQLPKYIDQLHATHDEDSVDRINYMYTNLLLLGFAILLSTKQYVGEPLQCWVPAQFKPGWEKYVESHCFIENTYFVRHDELLPNSAEEKDQRELAYYQWIPFILLIQAAFCYAPRLIWKLLNPRSGLKLTAFIPVALTTKKDGTNKVLKTEKEEDVVKPLVQRLEERVDLSIKHPGHVHFGKFITILYMSVKFLWLVNVIIQFIILDAFLGPQYTFWGFGIVVDLLKGRHWKTSGHFPRVTMCDVTVREMGNLHNWTVQCVLMVNMFAEKIFLFLWFWFCFVTIVNIANFIYWLYVSTSAAQSRSFVRKYLEFNGKTAEPDMKIEKFINEKLRKDGLTILRLIADNSGDLAVAGIVKQLWTAWEANLSSSRSTVTSEETDIGYTEEKTALLL